MPIVSKKKKTDQPAGDIRDMDVDTDDRFAFIAGYIPSGFPYGTTWGRYILVLLNVV